MPFPTPLPVAVPATRSVRPTRRTGLLVLTAFALAAIACVSGHAAGLVLLVLATAVLGVAAVIAIRAHWAVALAEEPLPPVLPAAPAVRTDDDLAQELRRLHAAHVEKVNGALDEGREDLARELSDAYTDEALELITRR